MSRSTEPPSNNDNADVPAAPDPPNADTTAKYVEVYQFEDDTQAHELETLFKSILAETNQVSKEPVMTHEVAQAKMLNYCIRMLHSEGWMPQTIIRAMVIKECDPDKPVRKAMWQGFKEKREEMRVERAMRTGVDGAQGNNL